MKLQDLLGVIHRDRRIAIIGCGVDIEKPCYQVIWHHRDLLNKNIVDLGAEDGVIVVLISEEDSL